MEQIYLTAVILRPSGCHKNLFVGRRVFHCPSGSFLFVYVSRGEAARNEEAIKYYGVLCKEGLVTGKKTKLRAINLGW